MRKKSAVIRSSALLMLSIGCGSSSKIVTVNEQELTSELIESSRSRDRSVWWPAVNTLGQLARSDSQKRQHIWDEAQVNMLGMKFVEVSAGSFKMGPDLHRVFNAQMEHEVIITRAYHISVTEVTNAQYKRIVPEFQADSKYSPDDDSPATRITWDDAARFCELLSQLEACHYRLPTEAEWEYACRAGTTTRYSFGDDSDSLKEYAWYNRAGGRASDVAMLLPNGWSIYDMHGNVFEWTSDWYSDTYYKQCFDSGSVTNPTGPPSGMSHVLRGGGWQVDNPLALTSSARFPLPILDRRPFDPPPGIRETIGFRVVRDP